MKYLIKAITTNNRDLKTSILFSFEEKAYLFNCPDGFQRMALNQKMKFRPIRYLFLSSLHPDHYGGVPGFYLSSRESCIQTQEDIKTFKIGIIGPEKLKDLLVKGRQFIGNLNHIEVYEYGSLNKFITEKFVNNKYGLHQCLAQNAVLQQEEQKIQQLQQNHIQEEEKKSYEEVKIEDNPIFDDGDLKVIPIKACSTFQQESDCYSFICIPRQAPGKFQPKKAIELGLDPKIHFKILTAGGTVTLPNGDIVYPFQVIDKPIPQQSMMFCFIPNVNYLDSFLSEENKAQFIPFFEENLDQSLTQLHLIYHSIPFEVLMNPRYREFMQNFGPNVKHVIDCDGGQDEIIAKTKSYMLTQRQKIVCPSLIPISQPKLRKLYTENKERVDEYLNGLKYANSQMGLVYNLFPISQQGEQLNQVITAQEYSNPVESDIKQSLKATIENYFINKQHEDPSFNFIEKQNLSTEIDDKEPNILFLGTISMKPTQYRSASAIYMFIKGFGILMDCAEGSYGQIYDHFQDEQKTKDAIFKLRVAFITHIHGDHQLGIIKIMSERDKLLSGHDETNKLYIVTPQPMFDYMDEYRKLILKYPDMVVLVPISDLNPEEQLFYDEELQPYNPKKPNVHAQKVCQQNSSNQKKESPARTYDEVNEKIYNHQPKDPRTIEMQEVLQKTMNVSHLKAIETNHCTESFACMVESPDFGRILYTGDTKPCQTILNYAQNVTLLIHEATFDDSLEEDAYIKKHTTMGQAIEVAKQCKPWRTILTHFSPRYQKIAETDDRHVDNKILVAFDHMRFKLSYLEWAYKFLDVYKRNFSNDDSLDQQEQIIQKKQVNIKNNNQKQQRQKTK